MYYIFKNTITVDNVRVTILPNDYKFQSFKDYQYAYIQTPPDRANLRLRFEHLVPQNRIYLALERTELTRKLIAGLREMGHTFETHFDKRKYDLKFDDGIKFSSNKFPPLGELSSVFGTLFAKMTLVPQTRFMMVRAKYVRNVIDIKKNCLVGYWRVGEEEGLFHFFNTTDHGIIRDRVDFDNLEGFNEELRREFLIRWPMFGNKEVQFMMLKPELAVSAWEMFAPHQIKPLEMVDDSVA